MSLYYICQGGYVFTPVHKFVSLFCWQDYAKHIEWIPAKLSGRMKHGPRKHPLSFEEDPDKAADRLSIFALSLTLLDELF